MEECKWELWRGKGGPLGRQDYWRSLVLDDRQGSGNEGGRERKDGGSDEDDDDDDDDADDDDGENESTL
jgi:hypothetical protein